MSTGVWNNTWPNQNAQRSFPLLPTVSRVSLGGVAIPDDLILSMILPVYASHAIQPNRYFISSIVVVGSGMTVSVSYDDGSLNPPVVATTSFTIGSHVENASYLLVGQGRLLNVVGHMQFGTLAAIKKMPGGSHEFTAATATIEPFCIRPTLPGVYGVTVTTGSTTSPLLTGNLSFVAGRNAAWSYSAVEDGYHIRLDAVSGAGLATSCVCDGSDATPPAIRRINDVTASIDGRIEIIGNDCLQVSTPGTNRLGLSDTCSQPCCGARELEVVTTTLGNMAAGQAGIETQMQRLEGTVNRFSLTVLGSRLNDFPCILPNA